MSENVSIYLYENNEESTSGRLKGKITCQKGDNLLSVLQRIDLISTASCGGKGLCGACVIQFVKEAPIPTPVERSFFDPERLRQGFRLSCRIAVAKDMHLIIPEHKKEPNVIFGNLALEESEAEMTEKETVILVDLGTTTIAMELRDLKSGKILGQYAALNPQRRYGADVISRMEYALKGEKEALELSTLVREEIQKGLHYFETIAVPTTEPIPRVFLAGNTVMVHLLLGLRVKELSVYPFVPVTLDFQTLLIGDYEITVLPGISAFVGADIVADLYAADMIPTIDRGRTTSAEILPNQPAPHQTSPIQPASAKGMDARELLAGQEKKKKLLADLGTNAELAYFDGNRLTVTATAAGPAFEGGVTTGIFGADLIKLTAMLLEKKQLDSTGLLAGEAFEKGAVVDGILIRNEDIRRLQLAKAAVAAGIMKLGVPSDTEVVLAGGFGYYLDVESSLRIGLLPGIEKARVHTVGNLVLEGLYKIAAALQSGRMKKIILQEYLHHVEVINLAQQSDFEQMYLEQIHFPAEI